MVTTGVPKAMSSCRSPQKNCSLQANWACQGPSSRLPGQIPHFLVCEEGRMSDGERNWEYCLGNSSQMATWRPRNRHFSLVGVVCICVSSSVRKLKFYWHTVTLLFMYCLWLLLSRRCLLFSCLPTLNILTPAAYLLQMRTISLRTI